MEFIHPPSCSFDHISLSLASLAWYYLVFISLYSCFLFIIKVSFISLISLLFSLSMLFISSSLMISLISRLLLFCFHISLSICSIHHSCFISLSLSSLFHYLLFSLISTWSCFFISLSLHFSRQCFRLSIRMSALTSKNFARQRTL